MLFCLVCAGIDFKIFSTFDVEIEIELPRFLLSFARLVLFVHVLLFNCLEEWPTLRARRI